MGAIDAVRAEIRELANKRDTLTSELADLRTEYREIDKRRREIVARQEAINNASPQLDARITVLEQVLALLEERLPNDVPAPSPVPDTPPKAKTPALAPARTTTASDGERRGLLIDPLHVFPKRVPNGISRGHRKPPVARADQVDDQLAPRIANPTKTAQERADLVALVLEDGPMSQFELKVHMAELLNCNVGTAQTIVSECLGILQHQRRVVATGEKVPTTPGGRACSPVWQLRRGVESDDAATQK